MKKIFICLVILFFNLFSVNGLYFHLFRDESRCFYDEFYTDTVIFNF